MPSEEVPAVVVVMVVSWYWQSPLMPHEKASRFPWLGCLLLSKALGFTDGEYKAVMVLELGPHSNSKISSLLFLSPRRQILKVMVPVAYGCLHVD